MPLTAADVLAVAQETDIENPEVTTSTSRSGRVFLWLEYGPPGARNRTAFLSDETNDTARLRIRNVMFEHCPERLAKT